MSTFPADQGPHGKQRSLPSFFFPFFGKICRWDQVWNSHLKTIDLICLISGLGRKEGVCLWCRKAVHAVQSVLLWKWPCITLASTVTFEEMEMSRQRSLERRLSGHYKSTQTLTLTVPAGGHNKQTHIILKYASGLVFSRHLIFQIYFHILLHFVSELIFFKAS